MTKEQEIRSKEKQKNIKLVLVTTLFLTIPAFLAWIIIWIKPMFILNENQILYAFSASAQVIAGLYGLTLTGYIFHQSKMEQKVVNDDTVEDQVNSIKMESHRSQIVVSAVSLLTIVMSLITIYSYNNINLSDSIIKFILNFSGILVILNVSMIISQSIIVVNPRRIEILSNRLKVTIEKTYDGNEIIDDEGQSFGKFMITFNSLSDLIEDYVAELESNRTALYNTDKKRFRNISDMARILNLNEIIAARDVEIIDLFRKYRNAAAHGTEMKIDKKILEKLDLYYKYFAKLHEVRHDINKRNDAYKELHNAVFE